LLHLHLSKEGNREHSGSCSEQYMTRGEAKHA
jgi:hypothetical protein